MDRILFTALPQIHREKRDSHSIGWVWVSGGRIRNRFPGRRAMGVHETEPTTLLYVLPPLVILRGQLVFRGVGGWAKEIAFVATRVDSGCTDRGGGGATW